MQKYNVIIVNYQIMMLNPTLRNKLAIFLLIIEMVRSANIFCSAYCSGGNCNAIGSTGCNVSCPTPGFTQTGSTCSIDTTVYSILYESAVTGNSAYNVTANSSCNGYSYNGNYSGNSSVKVQNGVTVPPHYSMRIRLWVIWLSSSNWNSGDYIQAIVDGTNNTNISFSASGGYYNGSLCSGSKSNVLDTGDFTHTGTSLTVTIKGVSTASSVKWGIDQLMVLYYPCHNWCRTCTGSAANQCQSCANYSGINYLLTGTTCAATCNPTDYNNTANTCAACTAPCATCTGSATNCTSCNSTTYFVAINNTCPTTCPSGYYTNTTNNTCMLCTAPCATCNNIGTNCTSCNSTTYLVGVNNTCPTTCPSGYYTKTSNNTCMLCTAPCATCSSPTNCSSCTTGTFYVSSNNTCPATCPNGFFGNGSTNNCDPCNNWCLTCTGSAVNQCQSCANYSGISYLLTGTTCATTCNTTSYNNTANTCADCVTPCATCSSPTNCSSCVTGKFYVSSNNTCPATCPNGFFGNGSTNNCDPCNNWCRTCTGSAANQCQSCANYSGINYLLTGTTCAATCNPTDYNNTANTCAACTAPCATCTGSATNCTSCNSTTYFVAINNTCPTTCPSGYYTNTTNNTCMLCTAPCATCTGSATNCTSCNSTTYFVAINNTCPTTCPSGYYTNTTNNTCMLCTAPCATCNNIGTNCTSCNSTTYLVGVNNTCPTTCPSGYYTKTSNNTCMLCTAPCATCSSPTNCSSCTTGTFYVSSNNTCPATCPNGFFGNGSTNNCDPCNNFCLTCTGSAANQCQSCANYSGINYLLTGTTCAATCNPTDYNNTANTCAACTAPCATCTGSATNCTSCNSTTYFVAINNTCPTTCPSGYYTNTTNNTCMLCTAPCATCNNIGTNCTSCNSTTYLVGVNNTCPTTCPSGYYTKTSNNTCMLCTAPCATCSSPTNCSSCTTGTFYVSSNNTCPATCPNGFFGNGSTNNCDPCNNWCLTCTGSAVNQCQSCANYSGISYLLTGTTCATTCNTTSYNNTANTCADCVTPCATCSSATNCLSCVTGKFYVSSNNTCPATCPNGFFGNSSTNNCDPCNNWCFTCTGSTINQCQSCANYSGIRYLLTGTTCATTCNTTSYNNTANTCADCVTPCATCSSATNCSSCVTGKFYVSSNNTCPATCPNGFFGNGSTNNCDPCNNWCLTCTGSTNTQCQSCANYSGIHYLLTGTTCAATCNSSSYKDTANTCAPCTAPCATCSNSATTCTSCNSTTYLFSANSSCLLTCPNGYFPVTSPNTCNPCDSSCTICSGSPSPCTACNTTLNYYLYQSVCYNPCPLSTYSNATSGTCLACNTKCIQCSNTSTNCSSCASSYYLYNFNCLSSCPNQYYGDNSNNTCVACDVSCLLCVSLTNCSSCAARYLYLAYNNTCPSVCPSGFSTNTILSICVDCTPVNACVNLSLTIYLIENVVTSPIYIDLNFTHSINFTSFPYTQFQTIGFKNNSLSISNIFNMSYNITSKSSYRIILASNITGIYENQQIIVTTMAKNQTYFSLNNSIFMDSNFLLSKSLNWSYVNLPGLSSTQSVFVSSHAKGSDHLGTMLSGSFTKQLKKYGFILLVFNSLQITSCLILINTLLPQNMYEGIRIFATFIFYDVPSYESQSQKKLTIMDMYNVTRRRNLESLQQFRFRRTGFSSYFLYNTYPQMLCILIVDVLLLLCLHYVQKYGFLKRVTPYLFTTVHKFHEIAIMYFTLSLIFDFTYFDVNDSVRWISLIFCLFINLYFLAFHAYRYFHLMRYRYVDMDSKIYDNYIAKYGSMLKYIRYEEWSHQTKLNVFQVWTKPENYHMVSYIKKLAMMLALAVFYDVPKVQITCLILIQCIQIIRCYFTWPFAKRWRNIYRLVLQFVLLTLFVVVLILIQLFDSMISASASQLPTLSNSFYKLGWFGFSLVMIFNFGFFLIYLIGLYDSCKYTNKQMISDVRRQYYKQKYGKYEEISNKQEVERINRMIQKGIVQPLQFSQLPDIEVYIERYEIWKIDDTFKVKYDKVLKLFMNQKPLLKKAGNNTNIEEITSGTIIVKTNHGIYKLFKKVYDIVKDLHMKLFVLQTTMIVEQRKYKGCEKINYEPKLMKNLIYIITFEDEYRYKYEGKVLQGFPINVNALNEIAFQAKLKRL